MSLKADLSNTFALPNKKALYFVLTDYLYLLRGTTTDKYTSKWEL